MRVCVGRRDQPARAGVDRSAVEVGDHAPRGDAERDAGGEVDAAVQVSVGDVRSPLPGSDPREGERRGEDARTETRRERLVGEEADGRRPGLVGAGVHVEVDQQGRRRRHERPVAAVGAPAGDRPVGPIDGTAPRRDAHGDVHRHRPVPAAKFASRTADRRASDGRRSGRRCPASSRRSIGRTVGEHQCTMARSASTSTSVAKSPALPMRVSAVRSGPAPPRRPPLRRRWPVRRRPPRGTVPVVDDDEWSHRTIERPDPIRRSARPNDQAGS